MILEVEWGTRIQLKQYKKPDRRFNGPTIGLLVVQTNKRLLISSYLLG